MTRFTFAEFESVGENREACEMCKEIAERKSIKPLPLLLVGESGSGKTHLLCAIVDHVRKHAPRTALAYVTAKEFPDAVRALANEAGPVTRARAAMLLVDQFEKFTPDLLDLLGRVAPLFLEENRYLVIATQVHPENMPDLPPGLANLLRFGRTVHVQRPPSGKSEDQLSKLATENVTLRQELVSAHAESERLQEQFVKLEADRQAFKVNPQEREELLQAKNILEQEVRSLQRALDETRKQRDACQADAAALAAAEAELARLRKQLGSGATIPDRSAAVERVRALEEELQQAREAEKTAQAELDRWAIRAQAMIQQLDLNRARFAQTEEAYQQKVLDLRQRLARLTARNEQP